MDGSIGKFKKKQIQHTRRHYLILAVIIAFALLHPGNHATLAQENDQPVPAENTEQQPPSSDEQESTGGYPIKKRRIGGPTDVEWDLDNSFPKRGSALELILRCSESQENWYQTILGSTVQGLTFTKFGF